MQPQREEHGRRPVGSRDSRQRSTALLSRELRQAPSLHPLLWSLVLLLSNHVLIVHIVSATSQAEVDVRRGGQGWMLPLPWA